jgi:shikimate dehydrogenase
LPVAQRTRLAVLGSPIAHSKSPAIHRAAYRALGLPWSYESADVTGTDLVAHIGSLDSRWRGLSLTMPLKRDVLPLLSWRHPLVDRVGAANTVLFTDDGLRGYNTDVSGIIRSFADIGVTKLNSVHILGGGATAASVMVAVALMGAEEVLISVRGTSNLDEVHALARREHLRLRVRRFGDDAELAPLAFGAVVSTLPGTVDFSEPHQVRQGAVLFDVAYDPWPTPMAAHWSESGGRVISGLDLLVNQAVGQVRVFVNGDPEQQLVDEVAVVAAMRGAVA